jgi:hypothetical protein
MLLTQTKLRYESGVWFSQDFPLVMYHLEFRQNFLVMRWVSVAHQRENGLKADHIDIFDEFGTCACHT